MKRLLSAAALTTICALPATGADLTFQDPAGDDVGAGGLIYPTNEVFQPGAFDLRSFSVTRDGDMLRFDFEVGAPTQNAWQMAGGFDVQMFFVFVDTRSGGHVEDLPGLNIQFAEADAWDKAIIVSPQPEARVISEIPKAGVLAADVIAATQISADGPRITAHVPVTALPGGDPQTWGYQVIVQSNEGFPDGADLLTRKVNEFEEEYRFGGGDDSDCDPHVVDILGSPDQLAYACGTKRATLSMVRK